MSRKRTSTISKPKTDWDQVDALTDEQVRGAIEADPEAHPTDENFGSSAKFVGRNRLPSPLQQASG